MPLTVGVNSYIDVDDADDYFADALHAAKWEDTDVTDKEKALVTAYRMMDRQIWRGEKTGGPAQVQDWPRTGLTTQEGDTIDDSTVPQFVMDAQAELALALLLSLSVQTGSDTSSNIRSVAAGSAKVEFFIGKAGPRFPTIINELIGFYLEGKSFVDVPFVSGSDVLSSIGDYGLTGGL